MSWTCEVCYKEHKDSNEVDCHLRLGGDFEIQLCSRCEEAFREAVCEFLRNFIRPFKKRE